VTLAYTGSSHPTLKISCWFSIAYVIHKSPSVKFFKNVLKCVKILWWGTVSILSNHKAGGLPLVGSPWMPIRYIPSYPPYLEAFSSIHNLRASHVLVTGNFNKMMYEWTASTHVRSFGTNCMIKCTLICEPVLLIEFHNHTEFMYNNCLRNVLQYLERLREEYIQSCLVT
jgi:hypothetical protein